MLHDQTRTKTAYGLQWNRFRILRPEEDRVTFANRTGWGRADLEAKAILDAGCGMGRYLRIAGESPARLIVGLDLPSVAEAEAMVARLGSSVSFYKIGMELAYGGGLALVARLAAGGKKVFLDLKLHDIPNTVERATAQVARLGATFLTVHAYPQTMRAAAAGVAGSGLKLLAVTVLTSAEDSDLAEAGYALGVSALVKRRGAQAKAAGISGLEAVCLIMTR